MSEFHSLANLIKRLEVATTRLEDLAMSSSSASAVSASGAPTTVTASQPVNTTATTTTTTATAAAGVATNQVPAMVEKHDSAIYPSLEKFLSLSSELGELVSSQVDRYEKIKEDDDEPFYIGKFSETSC